MTERILIPARFRGPPGSGNGGYVSGVLAGHVDGDAEVTLRRPVPLDRAMLVERCEDGRTLLRDGDALIAEAGPATLELEPPAPPRLAEAVAAGRRNPTVADETYLHCFVCGSGRTEGDGLRVLVGPVEGQRLHAAPWTPHPAHADEAGAVRREYLWAALDCPGALAILDGREGELLLGRFAARIDAVVRAGERYIVAAWPIAEEGRKAWAGTAIFTEAGALCAIAKATWIAPRRAG